MKVLAFLQNMWVRNPDRVRRMIESDETGEFRSRLIEYALFAGCLTGRRLKAALGQAWCDRIIWEESSPVVTGKASDCPLPDAEHIRKTIAKHGPHAIVCLSSPALETIRKTVAT